MRPPAVCDHLSYATTCHIRPPVICDRFSMRVRFGINRLRAMGQSFQEWGSKCKALFIDA